MQIKTKFFLLDHKRDIMIY